MRRTAVAALASGLVVVAWVGGARADEVTEKAAQLFRAGADAYAHHQYAEAAHEFESAYRIAPRGATIYNAALAWEAAGEPVRAADDYAAAVGNDDTSSSQRGDAASHLKALEARLARLVVTGPADARVTVDDRADAGLPLATHLEPGHHTLSVAYAGGKTGAREVDASAGAEVVVRLAAPPASRDAHADEPPARGNHGASDAPGDANSTLRTLAWVSLGGAVLAGAGSVYLAVQGQSELNDFVHGGDHDSSQHDQAVNDRTASQVLGVVAGALAVTSVVLFVTNVGPSSTAALHVGPTGVAVRVAF
jgi:tetratricopeptide (TPR) repeat protein